MPTRVIGTKSGREVEVSNEIASVPTETGFHALIVEDDGTRGSVHTQLSISGVTLPIPLPPFRNVVRVDNEHPQGVIWTGAEERAIIYSAPKKT